MMVLQQAITAYSASPALFGNKHLQPMRRSRLASDALILPDTSDHRGGGRRKSDALGLPPTPPPPPQRDVKRRRSGVVRLPPDTSNHRQRAYNATRIQETYHGGRKSSTAGLLVSSKDLSQLESSGIPGIPLLVVEATDSDDGEGDSQSDQSSSPTLLSLEQKNQGKKLSRRLSRVTADQLYRLEPGEIDCPCLLHCKRNNKGSTAGNQSTQYDSNRRSSIVTHRQPPTTTTHTVRSVGTQTKPIKKMGIRKRILNAFKKR